MRARQMQPRPQSRLGQGWSSLTCLYPYPNPYKVRSEQRGMEKVSTGVGFASDVCSRKGEEALVR